MGAIAQTYYGQQDYPIDRPNLVIPEVMIDRFDCDPAEVMKPIFDTVWNAAGFRSLPHRAGSPAGWASEYCA